MQFLVTKKIKLLIMEKKRETKKKKEGNFNNPPPWLMSLIEITWSMHVVYAWLFFIVFRCVVFFYIFFNLSRIYPTQFI